MTSRGRDWKAAVGEGEAQILAEVRAAAIQACFSLRKEPDTIEGRKKARPWPEPDRSTCSTSASC
jgi:hypothetical protein